MKLIFVKSKSKTLVMLIFVLLIRMNLNAQPTITSISPISGPIGSNVTIIGTNFGLTPSNNIIFFGAVKATVNSSTPTNLNVSVPPGASYEPISVTNLSTNLTAYSLKPFNVTFPFCGVFDTSSFSPKIDITTGLTPVKVAVSDFDRDGKSDIITSNNSDATFSVFRNTSTVGNISLASKLDFNCGQYPEDISISDFNGDGKPDIVITHTYGSEISVFKNLSTPGAISFAPKIEITVNSGHYFITSGDLNKDGKPDIILTYRYGNYISILQNTSSSEEISFAAKMDITEGGGGDIEICDLDGDKKPDLAITGDAVSVLRNTSSGSTISFTTDTTFSLGLFAKGISSADLNGDEKSDLIILYNASTSLMSILKNISKPGNISFSSKVDYPTSQVCEYVSPADMDGNGKPDIIVSNYADNTVSIYINNSTSDEMSLAPKVDFNTGINPISLFISDLEGNGRPDIVVSNQNSNTISILKNYALPAAPDICMVTVDSTSSNNIIYWDETLYNGFDSIIVYRETISNIYKRIGAVSPGSSNFFVDTVRQLYFPYTGDPNMGSYRYKLQVRDTCGAYSDPGPYHNTIYISNNGSTFFWNHYEIEGLPIPIPQLFAYHLLRKENVQDTSWELIGGVSSSQLTLNDPDFDTYPNALRRIETQWEINCSNLRSNNAAYSNIDGVISSGVFENHQDHKIEVNIYPNPFSIETKISLSENLKNATLSVHNLVGQEVKHLANVAGQSIILYRENLPSGVYFIRLIHNHEVIAIKKLVIKD